MSLLARERWKDAYPEKRQKYFPAFLPEPGSRQPFLAGVILTGLESLDDAFFVGSGGRMPSDGPDASTSSGGVSTPARRAPDGVVSPLRILHHDVGDAVVGLSNS